MTSAYTPPAGMSRVPPEGLPRWLTIVLTLLVVGLGVGAAVFFFKTKPQPKKEPEDAVAPLVEVARAQKGTRSIRMVLTGEVQPSMKVIVMPEVGGKVVWQHPDLVPGGRFKKGETILRIDPRDYALALKQQQAQLAAQQLNVQMEKARQRVAEEEWQLYQKERKQAGLTKPPKPKTEGEPDEGEALALRKPHLESAEVAVGAVKTSIAKAQLQLSRTIVDAPFNAVVQSENVDLGQLVGPSMQLLTLVGTDTFWVQVSIPFDKLPYVKLPKDGEAGSPALVWLDTGHGRVERKGEVIRLLGDLDPVGRLARVLVEVKDPMLIESAPRLATGDEGDKAVSGLPLLLGSFVHVEIEGLELENVAEIPRRALQTDGKVYVLADDDTLRIEKVTVVWGSNDSVLVTGPLKDGERLVTTNLQTAVQGMKLRPLEAAKPEAGASGEPPKGDQKPEGAKPAVADPKEARAN
jgi:multidrug efflux pump subunit AcrA (membrane-fusion protein)